MRSVTHILTPIVFKLVGLQGVDLVILALPHLHPTLTLTLIFNNLRNIADHGRGILPVRLIRTSLPTVILRFQIPQNLIGVGAGILRLAT